MACDLSSSAATAQYVIITGSYRFWYFPYRCRYKQCVKGTGANSREFCPGRLRKFTPFLPLQRIMTAVQTGDLATFLLPVPTIRVGRQATCLCLRLFQRRARSSRLKARPHSFLRDSLRLKTPQGRARASRKARPSRAPRAQKPRGTMRPLGTSGVLLPPRAR